MFGSENIDDRASICRSRRHFPPIFISERGSLDLIRLPSPADKRATPVVREPLLIFCMNLLMPALNLLHIVDKSILIHLHRLVLPCLSNKR